MRESVRPVLIDALLAAVLAGVTMYSVARSEAADAFGWPIYLFALLTAVPVVMRQRAPVLTTAIIVVALAAYGLIGYGYDEVPNGAIGLVVALFTVATLRPVTSPP